MNHILVMINYKTYNQLQPEGVKFSYNNWLVLKDLQIKQEGRKPFAFFDFYNIIYYYLNNSLGKIIILQ